VKRRGVSTARSKRSASSEVGFRIVAVITSLSSSARVEKSTKNEDFFETMGPLRLKPKERDW
jgi:hypothetical protein